MRLQIKPESQVDAMVDRWLEMIKMNMIIEATSGASMGQLASALESIGRMDIASKMIEGKFIANILNLSHISILTFRVLKVYTKVVPA